MNVKDQIAVRAAEAHRWTVAKAREAVRFSLARRDRRIPHLAELRNLKVDGADEPLDARLYVPDGAEPNGPLLLFFHGGGFIVGDLDTHDAFCARFADAAKMRILSCSYRLAPEYPFPAQRDDANAAARWTYANAASLGATPDRLLVGGDSAGGYLALATAAALPDLFVGQVLIYPLMHLEDEVWASSLGIDTRVIGRVAVRYIGSLLASAGESAPSLLAEGALSPLPTVIIAGGPLDPCAPDAVSCVERLEALGAPVIQRVYPGLMHGFINLTHASAAARTAIEELGALTAELVRR